MLVDPQNPDILAIAEVEFQASTGQLYVSRDGGRTWAETPANAVPPGTRACGAPWSAAPRCSPPPSGPCSPRFVLGDDRGQRPEVTDDFEASGLSHLLIVSRGRASFVVAEARQAGGVRPAASPFADVPKLLSHVKGSEPRGAVRRPPP